MSEKLWKNLNKISKIIENLKSDRPENQPFSSHWDFDIPWWKCISPVGKGPFF
jgi:hypothetical protein